MSLDVERFDELASAGSWQTIDEITDLLDRGEFWPQEWLDGSVREAKKQRVRQLLRSRKDEDGIAHWASVVEELADGSTRRVYKTEALFNADDYVVVIEFHESRVRHHAHTARIYRERGINKFGEQLRFKLGEAAA